MRNFAIEFDDPITQWTPQFNAATEAALDLREYFGEYFNESFQ